MKYLVFSWFIILSFCYSQCNDLLASQCYSNSNCEWVEDIDYGSCNNLGSSACDANPNCWGAYTNPGWYYGWYCAGGSYQIDNSYCQEIETIECVEMNQLGCANDDSCEWVQDIYTGYCGSHHTAASCPNYPVCSWSCDGCWYLGECCGSYICTGGSYQIDNSSCEEINFILGDANGDGSLNVSDIVLIVDLILNSIFDEYSDFNQDGVLNIIDVVELVNTILNRDN